MIWIKEVHHFPIFNLPRQIWHLDLLHFVLVKFGFQAWIMELGFIWIVEVLARPFDST